MWIIIIACILEIPLVLTLLGSGVDGDGWHWTLSDFVIIGVLLSITALIYEFAVRRITNNTYRVMGGLILFAALLLIWADLAVGIFDIPGISGN